jgi:NAD(P)-dependent dehydrogenase (short-subunit alcohol dehydrogenase family)
VITAGIEGKTAVVTGAAGSIGRAIVERLHAAKARVIAVDISEERLEALRTELGVLTAVADIGTPGGADRALAPAAGRVDILCNSAGAGDGLGTVDEIPDEVWDRVLAVNLTSAFLLAHRVVPMMLEHGGGTIINIASLAGIRGGRGGAAYTASKWGLVGLSHNIAATLGAEGIRCHAICPGRITGALTLAAGGITPRGQARRNRDSGRPDPGTPADVAAVVAFLLSDESSYLNGVTIPIDAGWSSY